MNIVLYKKYFIIQIKVKSQIWNCYLNQITTAITITITTIDHHNHVLLAKASQIKSKERYNNIHKIFIIN